MYLRGSQMSNTEDELRKINSHLDNIEREVKGPSLTDVLVQQATADVLEGHDKLCKKVENYKWEQRGEKNRPKWVGNLQDIIGGILFFVGFILLMIILTGSGYVDTKDWLITFGLLVGGLFIIWL
jgi:hypothetical protein